MTLLSYGCHGVGPLRSPGSELTQLLSVLNMSNTSLRSKRFRKQRKDRCFARAKYGAARKMGWPREKWDENQTAPFFARAKHRKSFSRSFFAPQPHRNACYAGWSNSCFLLSKGITIGSELIAWGLTKGAEVGSHLMQKVSKNWGVFSLLNCMLHLNIIYVCGDHSV